MAMVASLDLTSYLQAVSASYTPWTGCVSDRSYVQTSRCSVITTCRSMAHSHSATDLLRPAAPYIAGLSSSSACYQVPPSPDDEQDCGFRSRDCRQEAAAIADSTAAGDRDSGFSSDSSDDATFPASSLTSSSTSRRRSGAKRVSFADDVGLDLVTVHRYAPPPTVTSPQRPASRRRRLRLEPGFRQPWLDPVGLRSRVDRDSVALESVASRGAGMAFAGTILVANVAYEKRVTVRCTHDFWRTYVDVPAAYVTSSCPGGADLFAFEVEPSRTALAGSQPSPPRRAGGGRFEFAVRFQYRAHSDAEWAERWDNNQGLNYQLRASY